MIIGGIATLVLALGVSSILYRTGGPKTLSDNAAIIGALVALGGVFTAQMVGIALDANRAQQEALQAYLAKMSELLLDKHLLDKSNPYDAARVTARAQTLSVLERMNARRKRTVVLFLREARLINRYEYSPEGLNVTYYAHYVSLVGADLSGGDLEKAQLNSITGDEPVTLRATNLNGADLRGAVLSGIDLSDADLRGADLRDADLRGATLVGAAGVTKKKLEQQTSFMHDATMPDGSVRD
jgi:uncharacterized protein YjbI with pentapeptide repeats